MTSFTLLVCFHAIARCVCRLRVHKVSKQVNLVSNHQRMNAISTLLCYSCISVSWNFVPQTSRKFFAELFRKRTVIFPEISGKIPQEISGNFRNHSHNGDPPSLHTDWSHKGQQAVRWHVTELQVIIKLIKAINWCFKNCCWIRHSA